MPSFVDARRAARPRRRVDRLPRARASARPSAGRARLGLDRDAERRRRGPSVRLLHVDGDEDDLLAALLFEARRRAEEETRAAVGARSPRDERARAARRPRRRAREPPPPARPRLRGAALPLRDRLRLRRLPRPPAPPHADRASGSALTPDLGADVPEEVEAAGCGDAYRARARALARRVRAAGRRRAARARRPTRCRLGYRIRYVLDLNAREAMHLIELRSGREGHPTLPRRRARDARRRSPRSTRPSPRR